MSQIISCPNCSTVIPPDRINVAEMAAACPECAHVFRFSNLLSEPVPQVRSSGQPISLPKGFEVEHGISGLRIKIPWRATRRKGFLTLFAVLWNAFLTPFIISALKGDPQVALFISLHLAAGVILALNALSLWLNATWITAGAGGIDVRHSPIPVPFNPRRHIAAQEVEQFYVEEYVASRTNGRPDISFALRCKTSSGKDFRLVPGCTDAAHVLYLEQEIEKFLNIRDRPV